MIKTALLKIVRFGNFAIASMQQFIVTGVPYLAKSLEFLAKAETEKDS